MATYFRIVLWGTTLLLGATFTSGLLDPPRLDPMASVHMPMGLLCALAVLFFQAHLMSWVLVTSREVEHMERQGAVEPALLVEARALKARTLPWVVGTCLAVVVTSILGMGARAGVVPGRVHMALAAITVLLSARTAFLGVRVAGEVRDLAKRLPWEPGLGPEERPHGTPGRQFEGEGGGGGTAKSSRRVDSTEANSSRSSG